jgi:hypothetical protein
MPKKAYFDLYRVKTHPDAKGIIVRSLKPELGGPGQKKVLKHYEEQGFIVEYMGED